jgi:hypothetical protein
VGAAAVGRRALDGQGVRGEYPVGAR